VLLSGDPIGVDEEVLDPLLQPTLAAPGDAPVVAVGQPDGVVAARPLASERKRACFSPYRSTQTIFVRNLLASVAAAVRKSAALLLPFLSAPR